MGQQHRKEVKRRRRTAYIKRQKEIAKLAKSNGPVLLAKKVVKEEAPQEVAAKKAPAKKAAAKKAPAKKETPETAEA